MGGMPMIITLKSYLARLEDKERFKPEAARRKVPTITELSESKYVKVSRVQLQRIANGQVDSFKLSIGSGIIKDLRERGFDTNVSDILEYRDDEPVKNGHGVES